MRRKSQRQRVLPAGANGRNISKTPRCKPKRKYALVRMDQLAKELPSNLLDAIDNGLSLSVEQWLEWEKNKPPVHVEFKDGELLYEIRGSIKVPASKRKLVIAGGGFSTLWLAVTFGLQHQDKLLTILRQLFPN